MYGANESTQQLVEEGMRTGLTNMHTAHGFSVLYHVFAQKQCILCSALHHKSYLSLLYVALIQDSFCLGTFALGFIRLLSHSLISLQGHEVAINR